MNATTGSVNFEHLIAPSITKFLTAAEHLGTVAALRSQQFEGMDISQIIVQGLNASRTYFNQLEKLYNNIYGNPYLLKFIQSKGEAFKTEVTGSITEMLAGKTIKSALNPEYLLDRLKDAAMDLFALMHAKERCVCYGEVETEIDTDDPRLKAELEELGDVIRVLDDVLRAQPLKYYEAIYRYH